MRPVSSGVCSGDFGAKADRRTATLSLAMSVPFLNNNVEQDHRFVKEEHRSCPVIPVYRRCTQTQQGFAAMHMIKKGHARWLSKGDVVGQMRFGDQVFGICSRASRRHRLLMPRYLATDPSVYKRPFH
jgi:hypothetical protein